MHVLAQSQRHCAFKKLAGNLKWGAAMVAQFVERDAASMKLSSLNRVTAI